MARISGRIFYSNTNFQNIEVLMVRIEDLQGFPHTLTNENGEYTFTNVPVGYSYDLLVLPISYAGLEFENAHARVVISEEKEYSNVNISRTPYDPATNYTLTVDANVAPIPVTINGIFVGYTNHIKRAFAGNTMITLNVPEKIGKIGFRRWSSVDFPELEGQTSGNIVFTLSKSGRIYGTWEPLRTITFYSEPLPTTATLTFLDHLGTPRTISIPSGEIHQEFEEDLVDVVIQVPELVDSQAFNKWENGLKNRIREIGLVHTDLTLTAYYGEAEPPVSKIPWVILGELFSGFLLCIIGQSKL